MNSSTTLKMRDPNVSKEMLTVETGRLAVIMARVGKRLKNYIGKLGPDVLPDPDTMESARWYSATVLGLLKEQRERGLLAAKAGLAELSEAEHAEALEAFRRETLLAMSDDELERLKAERAKVKR